MKMQVCARVDTAEGCCPDLILGTDDGRGIRIRISAYDSLLLESILARNMEDDGTSIHKSMINAMLKLRGIPQRVYIEGFHDGKIRRYLYWYDKDENVEEAEGMRPANLVIIALLQNLPIYIDANFFEDSVGKVFVDSEGTSRVVRKYERKSISDLEKLKEEAILAEDYERAEEISDELKLRRK